MEYDVRGTVQKLFDDSGLMDILLGVEEYFDNADLYVFQGWIDGEIVEGPVVSKYWVEVTLKYDMDKMPDPRGAYLFENQGTKIMVRQDVERVIPKYAKDMDDLDIESGKVKEEKVPVILIKFVIPRRLVDAASVEEYKLLDDDMEETGDVLQDNMEEPMDDMEQAPEDEELM